MSDQIWTYFGNSTSMLEDHIKGAMARGVEVKSIAIGYGPSPAKVEGLPHGVDSWHAMLIVDPKGEKW